MQVRLPTPAFLLKLMDRPRIPMFWGRRPVTLEPEQRESIDLASDLRHLTLTGKYTGIWFHIPNEGKRGKLVALILRAMGLITGAPDYVFIWSGGSLLVELKVGKNDQTPKQRMFQQWAEHCGITYALCYSKEEVMASLQKEISKSQKPTYDYAELCR